MNPRVRISYDITTPESAEHGDYAETGWENEEGEPCTPDAIDLKDGATPVSLAVGIIMDDGPVEPSTWPTWHPRTWYTQTDGSTDYRTGAVKRYSYHLVDFTPEQEQEIYRQLKR